MSPSILTDPGEGELETAIHENLYALFRSMQTIPGSEVVEDEGLGLHHASPTNPMFKGAWKARLHSGEVEARIDEVIGWFKQRQAPYFFWWTDAQTQPTDLAERLLRRGFDGNPVGDPGMVIDLRDLNEEISCPDRLTILRAVAQEELQDWADAFAGGFEAAASDGQAWMDATLAAGGENAPWQLYVGYLDGAPVATSILFNGAGVAGIYGVGTIPQERRRGIGAAMTLQPLLDARQQGYHFAVLFSSRLGFSVYRRLGFREVAGKIGIYIMEMD